MSDYCLYPNLCGIGTDCSECHQGEIKHLRTRIAELEQQVETEKKRRREIDDESFRFADQLEQCRAGRAACEMELDKARTRITELEKANQPRPDYNLFCEDCGRAHILDTSLPSETWNRIAKPHNVLCTVCIDQRLTAAGLTAEAEFYFCGESLQSKLYDSNLRGRIAELEAERDQALKLLDHGICPDPFCDNNGTVSNSNGEPEPCQWCNERNAVLARTDTECCNQPDQCWEPCGGLGKSEAHAKPVTKIDPPSGPPPGPPDPPPYIPPKQG